MVRETDLDGLVSLPLAYCICPLDGLFNRSWRTLQHRGSCSTLVGRVSVHKMQLVNARAHCRSRLSRASYALPLVSWRLHVAELACWDGSYVKPARWWICCVSCHGLPAAQMEALSAELLTRAEVLSHVLCCGAGPRQLLSLSLAAELVARVRSAVAMDLTAL